MQTIFSCETISTAQNISDAVFMLTKPQYKSDLLQMVLYRFPRSKI